MEKQHKEDENPIIKEEVKQTTKEAKEEVKQTTKEAKEAVLSAFLKPEDPLLSQQAPKWSEMPLRRKAQLIAGWVFLAIEIAYVVNVLMAKQWFGETSTFAAILDSSLVTKENQTLVRLLASLFYILFVGGAAKIITDVLSFAFRHASNKAITIVKLNNSALKYASVLILLFVVLGLWGVDTATILASAGIVALIVGLGAQSFIADIIGGLSIVFEQQFAVGDIVVIDGFRGVVHEIGLTTTSLVDAAGNFKTIKNSQVMTVINLSRQLSVAVVDVHVDYDEDLQFVRSLLEKSLPEISKKIDGIIGQATYLGVEELQDSRVILRIVAHCKEEDKFGVRRELNEAILNLFDENHVNIPFNQMVISSRKDKK